MTYAGIELLAHRKGYYFEDPFMVEAYEHTPRRPHENLRVAFMEKHSLRESKSHRYPYWLRLLPKGMFHYTRYEKHQEGPQEAHKVMDQYHVCDHDELFVKNKKYTYTTQPYDLELEKYKRIEQYWKSLGLFVGISIEDAWHAPGSAPLVVIAQEPLELTGFQSE